MKAETKFSKESPYSKILVKDRGSIRTLYFVRDDGREAIESQMDLSEPHKLRLRYTRSMFASYLFVPEPKRVLLIGLGAGAMVRFLERDGPLRRHLSGHISEAI